MNSPSTGDVLTLLSEPPTMTKMRATNAAILLCLASYDLGVKCT